MRAAAVTVRPSKARPARGAGPGPHARLDVQFHDTVDPQRHAFFSRHLQRRAEGDRDVVVLQDVKDVALFQALAPLPADFLDLFHSPQVDRLLRTLVIYLQCYLHASTLHTRMLVIYLQCYLHASTLPPGAQARVLPPTPL
ncbi:uncharacterized protein LOC134538583 [Bacillus rossius redtenbacheri]|uniref:uncharacterized protein LOC134538583 n=1 Tax=Bacillus rossius redtenbacheri TaxID=93214 RepID=UPI002FDEDCDE